jgi:hypothetical protein
VNVFEVQIRDQTSRIAFIVEQFFLDQPDPRSQSPSKRSATLHREDDR